MAAAGAGASVTRRGVAWEACAIPPGLRGVVAAMRERHSEDGGWLVGVAWGTPRGEIVLEDMHPVSGKARCCYVEVAATGRRRGRAPETATDGTPLVLGNVIALRGPEVVWRADAAIPRAPPPAVRPGRGDPCCIACISGLWTADPLALDVTRAFLTGSLGSLDEVASIRRVVVLADHPPPGGSPLAQAAAFAAVDAWLTALNASIPVDMLFEENLAVPFEALSGGGGAGMSVAAGVLGISSGQPSSNSNSSSGNSNRRHGGPSTPAPAPPPIAVRSSPQRFVMGGGGGEPTAMARPALHIAAVAQRPHYFPASLATGVLHLSAHGSPHSFAVSTYALDPLPHVLVYPSHTFSARRVCEGTRVVGVPPLGSGEFVLVGAEGGAGTVRVEGVC